MLDNLQAPEGFDSSSVDRGGGLTWHGPGQLVGYPIFRWKEESVRTVITTIEEWILISLSKFKVKGNRDKAMQGVWFNGYKIASIGLAFSKWVFPKPTPPHMYKGLYLDKCSQTFFA